MSMSPEVASFRNLELDDSVDTSTHASEIVGVAPGDCAVGVESDHDHRLAICCQRNSTKTTHFLIIKLEPGINPVNPAMYRLPAESWVIGLPVSELLSQVS